MKKAEEIKQQAELYENLILNQIGVFINNKRKERNITIRDLNAITGVSIGVISDLENKKCMPRVETLIRIAEALEIPLSLVFENMKPVNIDNKKNGSKVIADDSSKYDKLGTCVAGLNYTKEDVAEIVSYAKYLDFKKQGKL